MYFFSRYSRFYFSHNFIEHSFHKNNDHKQFLLDSLVCFHIFSIFQVLKHHLIFTQPHQLLNLIPLHHLKLPFIFFFILFPIRFLALNHSCNLLYHEDIDSYHQKHNIQCHDNLYKVKDHNQTGRSFLHLQEL